MIVTYLILVLTGMVPSGGFSPGPEAPAAPSDKSVFVEYAEPTTSAPNWIRSTRVIIDGSGAVAGRADYLPLQITLGQQSVVRMLYL